MILHLVNDEKIINRTIELFEQVNPGNNLFVVFRRQKKEYIQRQSYTIEADKYRTLENVSVESVIIHSLDKKKIRFISKFEFKGIPVYWIIWGADLYNRLLEPLGYELYYPAGEYWRKKALKRLWGMPFHYLKQKLRVWQTFRFIRERVDYIVTDTTENDYEMLVKYFPDLHTIPWKDFFYYPIDQILGEELLEEQVKGNRIMIGNSCSLTNNHEYAMEILSRFDTADREIIVPLSYSGNREYRETVIRRGKQWFGEYFRPLTEFLPLSDYNRLLTEVSVVIYGNWRQEAIGNILIALYLGAKVFLSVRNPVHQWALAHSLKVYELERMTQQDLATPLDTETQLSNRKIISELYNRHRLLTLMQDTFSIRLGYKE